MKNLCVTTFYVLLFLLWADFMVSNGAAYRFVLTKIGVPENFIWMSSFALLGAYIAGEIYCGFVDGRKEKKNSVR